MKDDALFRLIFGTVMVIGSGIWMFTFLRNVRKSGDDSEILSLSRFRFILSLILAIIFGLFLIFYDFFE